ncbi:hypothetical protein ACJX0J_035913, partial [Zea mays]
EEANMKEGDDTLNQGNPSPWESQNEDSWKKNPHPMGEYGPKDLHVKKENVSKGKNVGAEEGKTGKSYSSCSGEEKNKEDDDSDLLGEDHTIIEEKNRRMAVKRNLEGNSCIPEPNFSCLASKEIIDISKKMGVNINEQNMKSIELLKEMELKKEVDNMEKKENTEKELRKFIGLQETMIGDCDEFITRKLDPSGDYLWLWSPAKGKSGGILVGSRIDDLDVGSFKKGNHILQFCDNSREPYIHNLVEIHMISGGFTCGSWENIFPLIASELKKLEEIEESDLLNSNQIDYRYNNICWDIVKNDILDIKEATKIQQLKKGKRLAYDKIGKYIKSYKGPR